MKNWFQSISKMALTILIPLAGFGLTGCAQMKIEEFNGKTPTLAIEDYFNGQTKAWGVFHDRFGKLKKEFTVTINGTWNPETQTLMLDEDFVYSDGTLDKRIWTISKNSDGTYTGTADDVKGVAIGHQSGNAFHWVYELGLEIGKEKKPFYVTMDDWMFLQPDSTVINITNMKKFGARLGTVSIFFRKKVVSP